LKAPAVQELFYYPISWLRKPIQSQRGFFLPLAFYQNLANDALKIRYDMGKGDITSEKGKRVRGTYGKYRTKKKKFRKYTVKAEVASESAKDEAPKTKKAPAKKTAAKKPAAKKASTTTTAKKAPAKKTTAKKTTAAKKKE
jgi:ribosomal small subunit protein bTHX